jgi:hypothetical protein
MTQQTLEDRVSAIEKTLAQLLAHMKSANNGKDWRSTIGMFSDDPVMKQIQEEGEKIRKAERQEAGS